MAKKLQLSEKRLSALEAKHGKAVLDAVADVFHAIEEERAEKEEFEKNVDDILNKIPE